MPKKSARVRKILARLRAKNKKRTLLTEGDIFKMKKGMCMYSDDPEEGDIEITAKTAGTFVVESTSFSGGGTGHGPHDRYPNGHRVNVASMKDHSLKGYLPNWAFYHYA